ncbi:dihydrolipoyl dehydrogenase family protein [Nitratireductor pacificus]|uniref:Pyridine nucleotide-disulfide oxidoreductase dimerization subunit n=1 Tax=Nitratireductor pacificus pht-3B TaxID=391937 RepID=K2MIY7_9HYPH|nr:FAD-dependent oxidoreductase [Nitratireductor pacificus]EKF20640.1 pyridine nucleotide-disulfide oxidoreductase dimerization subunit [Nitratireductor pacificus pht-3B]
MSTTLTPDICVIGAGSGGLTVAAAAAAFGVPVVLIEKGKMGGDCLNYGCVPSKALIAAGRQAHLMGQGGGFGVAPATADVDFRAVMKHVQQTIAAIAPNDSVERFTSLGVEVIQEEARFIDRRTVVAGDRTIRARRFVVATGSSPFIPPIPGIDTVPYLTNESIFEQTRLPGHLIVIGGGPIGIELAQAHRRLGSAVTVIEAAAALGKDDPELTALALERIRAEGVVIREQTKVTHVEKHGRSGVRVSVESAAGAETIDGTHLLVAAGRTPNLAALDLDKAGIAHDRKGIAVSDKLRTSNRRVYAIGDVAGGLQFTHVAGYHAGLVVRALLFRLPARENRAIIPWATFTEPEIAHVGLTEVEARKSHRNVSVLRWPYAENDRAQAERKTGGLIKLVTDRKGRILGASIVGADAGEMINFWALAVSQKLGVRDVAGYVAPYPTMTEIGKRAAITYYSEAPRKPLVRRLVRFLRRFG